MVVENNFGELLAQMAYEHLCDFDWDGAVRIYTESLMGMSEEMAERLVKGELIVTGSGNTVHVQERPENCSYLQLKSSFISTLLDVENGVGNMNMLIDLLGLQTHRTRPDLHPNYINVSIQISKTGMGGFPGNQTLQVNGNNLLDRIKKENWFTTDYKQYTSYKVLSKALDEREYHSLFQFTVSFKETKNFLHRCVGLLDLAQHMEIDSYLLNQATEALQRFKKVFEMDCFETAHTILPIGTNHYVDAGYISPDGKVYGMSGETAELLHLQLAEKICEEYKYEIPKNSWPEVELDTKGWIKFHGDQFLKFSDSNHLTEAQAKTMEDYSQKCLNGILSFEHDAIRVEKFRSMELLQQNELFF